MLYSSVEKEDFQREDRNDNGRSREEENIVKRTKNGKKIRGDSFDSFLHHFNISKSIDTDVKNNIRINNQESETS